MMTRIFLFGVILATGPDLFGARDPGHPPASGSLESAQNLARDERLLENLTARLEAMEAQLQRLTHRVSPLLPPTAEEEEAAMSMLLEAQNSARYFQSDVALKNVEALIAAHPKTQAAHRAEKVLIPHYRLFGQPSGPLSFESWLQGEKLKSDAALTLLVFWETWCLHCKDALQGLQTLYETYRSAGLEVVGVTAMSQGVTEEEARQILTAKGTTFPIAVDKGTLARRFRVSNIPTVVMIRDNRVLWIGHPGLCDEELMERALARIPTTPDPGLPSTGGPTTTVKRR